MPKTISVERIKSFHPCEDSWEVFKTAYPDRESVTWQEIYASNSIDDLLWVIAYELPRPALVGLLADLAAHVAHVYNEEYPDDSRVNDCISACRKFASGDIGIVELNAAANAAHAAALRAAAVADAARAARAANYAARAADYVARNAYAAVAAVAANYDAEREWQADHIITFMENYDEK